MSADLTEKQEVFARTYVECGNATEAYRRAYDCSETTDKSVNELACRSLSHVKIRSRIEQLQAKHQKRHEITVDKLTQMAIAAYDLAMKEDVAAPAAAVSALLAIGKLHGLVVDKKEVVQKRDATDLSLEELYAVARLGSPRNHPPVTGSRELDCVYTVHDAGVPAGPAPRLDS